MGVFLEKQFTEFDLFYPTKNIGFTAWGIKGIELLNNIKNAVNARLEELEYAQIFLPSVFNRSYFERYIGNDKKNSLLVGATYNQDNDLVLKPFSELIYADFLAKNMDRGNMASNYDKVFQWGLCFLNELHPSLCLNCNEITKCEIFSMHDDYIGAESTWNILNEVLFKTCIEDFRVYPLFGYRPGVSAFPSSRDTFAAELSLGVGEFQTLLVSHIMMDDFLRKNGFSEFSTKSLCSACFSQKMIAAVMIHHRDKHGFRYPYKLAPYTGIISSQSMQKNLLTGERVKILPNIGKGELKSAMLKQGAIWLIEEINTSSGSSKWLLWRRGYLEESSPIESNTFEEAFKKASLYVEQYDKQLLDESRQKVLASMLEIKSYDQYNELQNTQNLINKPNIFIPCCDNCDCQNSVLINIKWIPKLIYHDIPGRCIQCGMSTQKGIMFEQREMYTSFYVQKEGSR